MKKTQKLDFRVQKDIIAAQSSSTEPTNVVVERVK